MNTLQTQAKVGKETKTEVICQQELNIIEQLSMTDSCMIQDFYDHISDGKRIQMIINEHQAYEINLFLYHLICDFLNCKKLILTQLSREQCNIGIFILDLIQGLKHYSLNIRYLPRVCKKLMKSSKKREQNIQIELGILQGKMQILSGQCTEYQNELSSILQHYQQRTKKWKTKTYFEQIDELKSLMGNEMRIKIEKLSRDLNTIENEQLLCERHAEKLRLSAMKKFRRMKMNGKRRKSKPLVNVTEEDEEIVNIEQQNSYSNNSMNRIRKPFFLSKLGFIANIEICHGNENILVVGTVVEDGQAHKLKVYKGWQIVAVGIETNVECMHDILSNEVTDDILPLFVTFQINHF